MQNETRFKKRVLSDLKKLPRVWVVKVQQRAQRGVPDILFCLRGEFGAIELKDTGKKPERLQGVVLHRIAQAGGAAIWADPESWDQQFEVLKVLGLSAWRSRFAGR